MNTKSNSILIILSFSIFFGWVMSFPYEGPVLYALAGNRGLNGELLNTLTVFFHGGGLFLGRYLTTRHSNYKKTLLFLILGTLLLSFIIPFLNIFLWAYLLPLVSFLMGLVIVSFAYPLRNNTFYKDRGIIAANLLIYGNIILIFAHILAYNTNPILSFSFIEGLLLIGLFLLTKLDFSNKTINSELSLPKKHISLKKFWIFFLFIFIISINSGIMFSVIYPYFEGFPLLTSIYTNIPYILAIYFLSRIIKINKFYFLYIGLILWAISFVLFSIFSSTPLAFIIICSTMLFACGIFDFFWWSTMLENFELVKSPPSFLGLGLSLNVFGVWVGSVLASTLSTNTNKQVISIIGLLFVAICLVIILPLNVKLSRFLTHNKFLLTFGDLNPPTENDHLKTVESLLSNREFEVFNLLILKMTDKEICEKLFLAPSTVKSHNRSIYKKLSVKGRKDLYTKYML